MPDNSCTLIVESRSGSPDTSVRVSTEVSGGITCIGGRTFSTDRNGAAYIKWSSVVAISDKYISMALAIVWTSEMERLITLQ